MHRRLWLTVTMLVVGAGLLVAAGLASASGGTTHAFKKGGIFRVGIPSASVQVDQQVAYVTTAWWLEYATAAKLYNYPDRKGTAGAKLVPEVASRFTVSNNGRRYTFTIRPGFRFSDGAKVTARNFKRAIDRVANKKLSSPGAPFIIDPNGTNIVGAKAVHDGRGTNVRGAIARGNKLIVNLTKPDGTFMSKITMPFFQATSFKLPLGKEVSTISNIRQMPAAGPYAISRNSVDRLTQLRRNPFWKRGPGRSRPRNLTGLDVRWSQNEQTLFNQTLANQIDEDPVVPPAEVGGVARRFGVNKTRFWAQAQNCTGYLPMNTARSLFKSTNLRKGISYGVNRKQYVQQAGPFAGRPWTHLFNPGVPGWRNVSLYPLTPALAKARRLAGNLSSKKITVGFRTNSSANQNQAQIVRRDLIRLGFRSGNINMKGYPGADLYDVMGTRGTDLDMGVSMGWCSDYPDPYDWINILLYGKAIGPSNNNNYSYFNVPKWNRRMEAAARLVGPKRLRVYSQLDLDIMRQAAPVAAMRTYNNRYLFSKRVNPKSLVYQGIYQDWSIPALALK
jgi:peptide/nickel transport system substrate-binding protein